MGNSASALPYSIDKQVGAPKDHNGWAFHEGKSTKDADGTAVSVFVGKKPSLAKTPIHPQRFPTKMSLEPAYHHYLHCRKLRHPQILKVYATLDTDNPNAATNEGSNSASGATSSSYSNTSSSSSSSSSQLATTGDLIVVTEPCIPLEQWLTATNPKPTPEQLAWGLECIIRALHFLHDSAKLAHGNVSPSSFYVTLAGDVKLWNFSLVTPIGSSTNSSSSSSPSPSSIGPTLYFKEWESAITPDTYRSLERVEGRWDAISNAAVHCMDSYSLGILMDYWWSGKIPTPLQKATQRLLTTNLRMRPRLQPLLKCPIFATPYQTIQIQLEEITIQPVEQKVTIWQNLTSSLQSGRIQQQPALYKLLPLLKSSITTICANEAMVSQGLYRREVLAMLPALFFIYETHFNAATDKKQIGSDLEPLVALLFVVKDRGVRGILLSKVGYFLQVLEPHPLNVSVFEPLCSGFSDSSPALRELTLKATLGLVPVLNTPNLEKLSRYLVRLQSDTETSIRTNAVIFISKLASHLSEMSQQKLLLPAFARAMKDSFPPCRLAAIQATSQTKDYFNMTDRATKVLPAVMPLLLDPIPNVRNEAFAVVDTLVASLRQESDRMAHAEALQQQQQQQSGASTTTPAAVAPAPISGGSYLSGFSSWVSTSSVTRPSEESPQSMLPMSSPPSTVIPTTKPTFAAAPLTSPPPPVVVSKVPSTAIADDDGWGDEDVDDDDWGDDVDHAANVSSVKNNTTAMGGLSINDPFSATTMDDPFASIGTKPAVGARPRGTGGGSKLIVPKKTPVKQPVVVKPAAPATKLAMDDDEIADGWDDF